MIDYASLIKDTTAYKTVLGDKAFNRLSHAYLLVTADGNSLDEYLKIFAKLLLCSAQEPCGKCRACILIDGGVHPDAYFYPKEKQNVTVDDVNEIIEETYLKPIEGNKKLFVLSHGENLSPVVQNKLLKTLEEPPANVIILIGATVDFSLLSTVKSRVKRLEIPAFSQEKLINALKEDCPDLDKLSRACAHAEGSVGKAKELYGDDNVAKVTAFLSDMVLEMKSSANLLDFSIKFANEKIDVLDLISAMQLFYRDMLSYLSGNEKVIINKNNLDLIKKAQGYTLGSCVHILEKLTEAESRRKANANQQMLTEWLLFQVLEGKHKWLKL